MSVWTRADWRIESFAGNTPMMTTVHQGDASRDMELKAIAACHRTAIVTPLSREAKAQWTAGWRPPAEVAR